MPKTSRATAPNVQRVEGIVDDRSEDLDGYTVCFTQFLGEMDGAPLLRGAPHDHSQRPHRGYVLKAKITFRFPDRDKTYEAGDASYTPPGPPPQPSKGPETA